MAIIRTIEEYESSFDDFWKSIDELYKAILMLENSSDRNKLLIEYDKLTQCRERLWESKEELIERIDDCVRLK